MRVLRGDLHLHTALSPCADREMTPAAIVARAAEVGLSLVAVCDHNAAGNVAAVARAARGSGVAVLAGIEITTSEEAHLVGLFAGPSAARRVATRVRATLPPQGERLAWMGPQVLLDADGRVRGEDDRMLAHASGLTLAGAVALIHAHGGLAIGAHVDRPSFSIPSQLGMIPEGLGLDAIEISAAGVRAGRAEAFAKVGLPIISSSDSHCLDQIGEGVTLLWMEAPILGELALALRGIAGRRCALA